LQKTGLSVHVRVDDPNAHTAGDLMSFALVDIGRIQERPNRRGWCNLVADSFVAPSVIFYECAQERLHAQEAASEVAIGLPPGVLQLLESLQLSTARVRGRKLFGGQALGMPKHVNMTCKRTEHMEVPFGFRYQSGMKGTERGDVLPRSVKRSVRPR
jgi:hypothetical protein